MSDIVGHRFTRTSPEKQGIASSTILEFIEALEQSEQEIHSYMLLKNGNVIAEGWWPPYGAEIPHMMFSLSKSFTSTAIGMAVDEGHFTVDDNVLSFFPDAVPDHVNEHIKAMQIKHLLTMSTGHDERPFPNMYDREDGNWAKGFFETPVIYAPGTHFMYNTAATYMLSEILQRVTGEKLVDYLKPRLFDPLGIKKATWIESPYGVTVAGVGISLTTEDIARLGQLYLQKGMWQGERLLSEAWINEATSWQVSNGDDPNSDWAQGYGYQFWRCQHGIYRGDGAFGQYCIVMDEYNTVLAMTSAAQNMQAILNIVWDVLLPGLKAADVPKEADETYQHTLEKSANLSILPIDGQSTSPTAGQVSGKTYIAEDNKLGIQSLSFEFDGPSCTLNMTTGAGEESITAVCGEWHYGHASVFDEIWLSGRLPLVASGCWVEEDCYVMVVRLYETPYVYTLTCEFEGDAVTMAIDLNVSLEAKEKHPIKAVCE